MSDVPSKEFFEIQQLRDEIERLIGEHKKDLREKNEQIREYKNLLNVKIRTERVTHAEYTTNYFPKFMLHLLKTFDHSGSFRNIYLNLMTLINFTIVVGIGYLVFLYTSRLLPRPVGIIVGFILTWNLSVGPLGYLFGLAPKRKREKRT